MMSDPDDTPIVMVPWVPPKNHTWKHILRAVTIFQLLQAEPSPFFEDKSLVIDGKGFGAVKLVAHVTKVEIRPAKARCTLEDGTGRIYADKEFHSLTQGQGLSAEEEEDETARYRALEHTYVEILGVPRKDLNSLWTQFSIAHIRPVQGYYQVMYHTLYVIHNNMLTQQHIQPYDIDADFGSNEDTEIHIPMDDDQAPDQDDISIRHPITHAIPASHVGVLPNTFSPQKHRPYAILEPLERAIMKYMCHHRNYPVFITELAQAIQASCGCTELQFNMAVQTLLSDAYITSPLDDGYVIITPRH